MTYYDILEVTHSASPEVIQMAYRALAKKYHPDVYSSDKTFAEIKMKQINEAYQVLSSPLLRAKYDQMLTQKTQSPHSQYKSTPNCQPSYTPPPRAEKWSAPPKKSPIEKLAPRLIPLLSAAMIFAILFLVLGLAEVFDKEDTSSPPPPSTEELPLPLDEVPLSGHILSGSESFNASEITVTAAYSEDCVVKLKTKTGSTVVSFYVRAGDSVTVGVPTDYLYVYFASGDTWYGEEKLFGENTYYSKDDEILDFGSYTWEYTLTPITSGNFSETPIDASEFN